MDARPYLGGPAPSARQQEAPRRASDRLSVLTQCRQGTLIHGRPSHQTLAHSGPVVAGRGAGRGYVGIA